MVVIYQDQNGIQHLLCEDIISKIAEYDKDVITKIIVIYFVMLAVVFEYWKSHFQTFEKYSGIRKGLSNT